MQIYNRRWVTVVGISWLPYCTYSQKSSGMKINQLPSHRINNKTFIFLSFLTLFSHANLLDRMEREEENKQNVLPFSPSDVWFFPCPAIWNLLLSIKQFYQNIFILLFCLLFPLYPFDSVLSLKWSVGAQDFIYNYAFMTYRYEIN